MHTCSSSKRICLKLRAGMTSEPLCNVCRCNCKKPHQHEVGDLMEAMEERMYDFPVLATTSQHSSRIQTLNW